jgi:hypothetical protein
LADFEKLAKETFKIKLEDCEIEVRLSDFKIVEKYDEKYLYTEYMKLLNNNTSMKCDIDKHHLIFEKSSFGTKQHFTAFKKLLEGISYYQNETETINNNNKLVCNFDCDKTDLITVKHHLNYISKHIKTQFENCDELQEVSDVVMSDYTTNTVITSTMIGQFKYLNGKLPKYKKMKIKI